MYLGVCAPPDLKVFPFWAWPEQPIRPKTGEAKEGGWSVGIDWVRRGLWPKILIVSLLVGGVGLVAVVALRTNASPTAGRVDKMALGRHEGDVAAARALGTGDLAHSPGDCHPVGRPYLGITYVPLSEAAARIYGVGTREGVLVTAVDANSPAEKAGLRSNDVIVEFGGVPLTPNDSLVSLQMKYRSGESVSLTIMRRNELRQVKVTLAAMDVN